MTTPSPTATTPATPKGDLAVATGPAPAVTRGRSFSEAEVERLVRRGFPWDYAVLAVVVLVGASLPFMLSSAELGIGMRVLVFALMGIGWNIMSGYGGMFSFGHAAYFGVGAYATAYTVAVLGTSPWLGMLIGIVVAAAAAVGLSYLALRYRLEGAYYAMSTFAFAEVLRLFVIGNDAFKRTAGITVPVEPRESFWMFQYDAGSPMYFWIGLGMVAVAMLVSILFIRSRAGRATAAVRDDETAAAATGIDVVRRKLSAAALSAGITAVAGTLYVQYYMFIDPDLAFGPAVSNSAIITAVVGGAGTVWGPLVGAVIMAPLSDLVAGFVRTPPAPLAWMAGHSGLDIVLYAVILVAVVLLLPRGICGSLRKGVRRR